MVFSSNIFLFFFLPAVLLLYYLSPRRWRNPLLFLLSLVFYGWGEPVYVLLMIAVIVLNYASGLMIAKEKASGKSGKRVLIVSLILNLSILAFFKYSALLIGSVNTLLPESLRMPLLRIALPIGISFYIFQSLSYTIDVYRGEVQCQRNLIDFGTYVALFPQLIAGPIVRYRDIAFQLRSRQESSALFSQGVQMFIIGLAKKVLLANKIGELCEALRISGGSLSGWVCVFAYSFQIYFDFSGYSDMAIGLGKLFGFEFLPNFRYPYCSVSITEFWRRWHISLGTWFREYLYIPLGGNRRGILRQILNILIVWALTGLWHGASWNFALWGLFYAFLLVAEKLFLLRILQKIPSWIRILMTFFTASFGWIIFSCTGLNEFWSFLRRLFSLTADSAHARNLVLASLPLLAITAVGSTPFPRKLFGKLAGTKIFPMLQTGYLGLLLVLCVAFLANQSYNPFIYFRF